jgi:hypothetical protein
MNGTLTITLAVNVGGRAKKVTLLREYYINEKTAAETKENFVRLNDKFLDTDRIVCMWQPLGKMI